MIGTGINPVRLKYFSKFLYFLPAQAIDDARLFRIILDELDSGLDVDSLKIVCDNINNYLKETKDTSILMITHYPRILEYIKPDYIHVLKDGKIVETGDITLAEKIDKFGYGIFNN